MFPNNGIHKRYNKVNMDRERNEAYYATLALLPFPVAEKPCLEMSFYPPDNRRRDLDNIFAACKRKIDGISLALKVDDYFFSYKIERCSPISGGKVVVKIV